MFQNCSLLGGKVCPVAQLKRQEIFVSPKEQRLSALVKTR